MQLRLKFSSVVAKVQVKQGGQIAEHALVVELHDFVLLEVQLDQLGEVAADEDVVQVGGQLRRRVVGERVRQVQLLQVDKVGEDARMVVVILFVVVARDAQVVVVQDEPAHVRHVVVRLAADLADVVVAHVDDRQVGEVVQRTEHVPRQLLHVVAVEDEHLRLRGQVLEHGRVPEACVRAVDHVLRAVVVRLQAAAAPSLELTAAVVRHADDDADGYASGVSSLSILPFHNKCFAAAMPNKSVEGPIVPDTHVRTVPMGKDYHTQEPPIN
uniref:Uncharacterized protein n=1 Tax=Anopheles atroparvus TaxID=41427 RepID=A0A182IVM5_ANOAO